MPWVKDEKMLPVIDFGDTLEIVGITTVTQILRNALSRAKIRINYTFTTKDKKIIYDNIEN